MKGDVFMPKRYIILQPIGNNKGNGVVTIGDETITVNLSGTKEELKIFFLSSSHSGEDSKIDAGTIRGGFAKSYSLSKEDIRKIDTVVLIKDSEPVIYGSLGSFMPSIKHDINNEVKKDGQKQGKLWLRI